ncbi:MAG: dTMP kinase [Alphaproteobacteria bacterium]
MSESKGLFITFEGGEGSGKTTQVNRLAQFLTEKTRKVVTTREPGGTPEGEKIRDLLVQREGGEWNPVSEVLLLFAARAMHIDKIIRPALEKGKIVISDRFTDSTRAYQGYGHKFPLETIENLNSMVLGNFAPDLTFILDIDAGKGVARSGRRIAAEALHIKQTEDRFEQMEPGFHERLRQGFLDIAKKEPERCHVLDATLKPDDLAKKIQKTVLEKI